MNLLMAIISDSKELSSIISNMSAAVKSGDLEKFQESADQVINKIERKNFIKLSEEVWEKVLVDVRKINPKFQSNFVLKAKEIEELLKIEELPQALSKNLLLAKKENKQVLQFLQDDED
jgi:hypothetical protein